MWYMAFYAILPVVLFVIGIVWCYTSQWLLSTIPEDSMQIDLCTLRSNMEVLNKFIWNVVFAP